MEILRQLRMVVGPRTCPFGPTALDLAVRNHHELCAELIKTKVAVASGDEVKPLPRVVAEAAMSGDVQYVCEWLDVGGPIECKGLLAKGAPTLLLLAAEHGHEQLVDALLRRRASTEATQGAVEGGSTPMMLAAFAGHTGVTRRLLLHQLRHGQAPAFCSPPLMERIGPKTPDMHIPEYALNFRQRITKSEPHLVPAAF